MSLELVKKHNIKTCLIDRYWQKKYLNPQKRCCLLGFQLTSHAIRESWSSRRKGCCDNVSADAAVPSLLKAASLIKWHISVCVLCSLERILCEKNQFEWLLTFSILSLLSILLSYVYYFVHIEWVFIAFFLTSSHNKTKKINPFNSSKYHL